MAIAIVPLIVLVGLIAAVVAYIKTKNWKYVLSVIQIVLALTVIGVGFYFQDSNLMATVEFIGVGLLISGIAGFLK